LLRPGRFEVHLEISLPDEKGRRQIFKIHTAKMKREKKLDKDVSIEELASLTKNFSGAEIEGLVKSAASFALNRNIKMDPVKGIMFDSKKEVMVVRDDFMKALDENKPAFGVSEEDLAGNVRGDIIKYSPYITQVLDMGTKLIQQVKESDQFPLISVLIHGPSGSGKTALASSIALSSGFPFIRFISPEAMIGMNETARVQYLSQMFQDSYRSPMNAIVIDQIEDIMDWVNIGPRFSNSVLQTLKVFLRKFPPKDRKLIIFVTTTQRSILEQMDLLKGFNKEIHIPSISSLDNLNHIFEEVGFLDPQSQQRAVAEIQKETDSSVLGIGIKNILFNIEAAKLSGSGNELQEFVDLTSRDILSQPGRQYSNRSIQ
jgi:vesicle-fusing ATPase